MFVKRRIKKLILSVSIFTLSFSLLKAQDLVISPSPLYLGKIPTGSSSEREVVIFNMTINQVTVNSISVTGPDASRFTIVDNPGSFTLGGIEKKAVTIRYEANDAEKNIAILNVESDAGNYSDSLIAYGIPPSGGVQAFERILGTSEDDSPGNIKHTNDGGFIIVGSTIPPQEEFNNIYLIKTDEYGKVEWSSVYGDNDGVDSGTDVEQTPDGGYIVLGTTENWGAGGTDLMLIKFNSAGDYQWRKTYGSSSNDASSAMVPTTDGGYVLVGNTVPSSGIGKNIYLVKVDGEGNQKWENSYGGNSGTDAFDLVELSDGSILAVGFIAVDTDFQIYLIKVNANGNLLWEKSYGGTEYDVGYSINRTSDDGFIISGYTASKGAGGRDGYLVKVNSSGDLIWDKTYGSERSDEFSGAIEGLDGSFYAVGNSVTRVTQNDQFKSAFIVKTDADGNEVWAKIFGGDLDDNLGEIHQANDGGLICIGGTASFGKSDDIFLLKIGDSGTISNVENNLYVNVNKDFVLHQNYPNPFNPETTIKFSILNGSTNNRNVHVKLTVFDLLGNEIQNLVDDYKTEGTYEVKFNGGDLSSGVYVYKLSIDGRKEVIKMIQLK